MWLLKYNTSLSSEGSNTLLCRGLAQILSLCKCLINLENRILLYVDNFCLTQSISCSERGCLERSLNLDYSSDVEYKAGMDIEIQSWILISD